MGKVFRPRARHNRDRSLHRMSDRHAGSDTEPEVSQRRSDERFQRHRVERVHGTGQRQKPDRPQLGLFGQFVGRRPLQVFVPLRSSAAGAVFSRHATHYRSAVEHGSAGSQQCHVNILIITEVHNIFYDHFVLRTDAATIIITLSVFIRNY